MGIKAAQQISPHWFTPVGQDADDEPTQFFVEPLTERDRANYQMQVVERDGRLVLEGSVFYDIALTKVKDWRNFPADAPEDFSRSGLKTVPAAIMSEIGVHIWTAAELSEDAEKNS